MEYETFLQGLQLSHAFQVDVSVKLDICNILMGQDIYALSTRHIAD